MKELSIEEKAKAYDEILERAREEYEIYKGIKDVYHCEALERIFHKLAESEDESIRKRLIELLKKNDERHFAKEIAWLEKQGEPKPAEKPVWYDNMDDLIADGMIDEIQKSDLPEGSKHNRIYWIEKHRAKPVEWSEDDEKYLNIVYSAILSAGVQGIYDYHKVTNNDVRKWLDKSLRPQNHWKPSDEQMLVMEYIKNCFDFSKPSYREIFISVYEQLKEL